MFVAELGHIEADSTLSSDLSKRRSVGDDGVPVILILNAAGLVFLQK